MMKKIDNEHACNKEIFDNPIEIEATCVNYSINFLEAFHYQRRIFSGKIEKNKN